MSSEKELSFLNEYEELCKKYQIILGTCGCCGSPWLVDLDKSKEEWTIEDHIEHLKEWTVE